MYAHMFIQQGPNWKIGQSHADEQMRDDDCFYPLCMYMGLTTQYLSIIIMHTGQLHGNSPPSLPWSVMKSTGHPMMLPKHSLSMSLLVGMELVCELRYHDNSDPYERTGTCTLVLRTCTYMQIAFAHYIYMTVYTIH